MITCGFVGLGLIGGSIARALKANRKDIVIIACDPNEETLKLATEQKIADEAYPAPCDAFTACDYIFLCAPVSHNDENLLKILSYRKKDCILTDVGSVKTPINSLIHSLGLTDCFIGGHPMAGSERIGFANSKAGLLENAYYILAPAPQVPAAKIAEFQGLVTSMGAIPLQVESQKHDYVTAAVSHLPHIVAAALVHLVQDHDDAQGLMKSIAAGGFKDITRIASSSPVMWEQICMTNTENILVLLKRYITSLESICDTLENHNGDAIYKMFEESGKYRSTFPNRGQGPIERDYSFCVDVLDEPGSISVLSAILAAKGISVKNIGINHSREEGEGALRISFYREDKKNEAAELLRSHNYVLTK